MSAYPIQSLGEPMRESALVSTGSTSQLIEEGDLVETENALDA